MDNGMIRGAHFFTCDIKHFGQVARLSFAVLSHFMGVFVFAGDGVKWMAAGSSSWRLGDVVQIPS
jgi:hypothetical protein